MSYEQMVESMTEKAVELAEKSPASRTATDTSSVAARYNSVKEQAKVTLHIFKYFFPYLLHLSVK